MPELQEAARSVGLKWENFKVTDNSCKPHPRPEKRPGRVSQLNNLCHTSCTCSVFDFEYVRSPAFEAKLASCCTQPCLLYRHALRAAKHALLGPLTGLMGVV